MILIEDEASMLKELSSEDILAGVTTIEDIHTLYTTAIQNTNFVNDNVILVLNDNNQNDTFDIDVLSFLKKRYSTITLINSHYLQSQSVLKELMTLGIISYVDRYTSFKEIVKCTKAINTNGYYLSPSIVRTLLEYMSHTVPPATKHKLTERQHQIMGLLAKGKTYKEISTALFISVNTVGFHVKQIYKKYGAKNKSQAIATYLGSANQQLY